MINLTGVVLDPYDDGFASMGDMFQGREVPDFIKEAEIMENDQLASLPDHAFAVVMVGGGQPLRKYACTNKAHTAVNVMYFLNTRDGLPKLARAKAARNLLASCRHFGLEAPSELQKEAENVKTLIKADAPPLITTIDRDERSNELGTVERAGEHEAAKEIVDDSRKKEADVSGTRTAPYTRPSRKKLAFVMEDPFVDISHDLPSMIVKAASSNSLETYEQVEAAERFFVEEGHRLHPRERHQFCVKLAARAEALGHKLPDPIRAYGSLTYADDPTIKVAVQMRERMWRDLGNEVGHGMVEELMQKRASIDPEVFAESLAELDALTGLDLYWDSDVADPWMSTFGIPKVAEWSWIDGADVVKEDQLKYLAQAGRDNIKDNFGKDFVKEFVNNPTAIFDSLPLDKKRVIARMANLQESRTGADFTQ